MFAEAVEKLLSTVDTALILFTLSNDLIQFEIESPHVPASLNKEFDKQAIKRVIGMSDKPLANE